MKLTIKHAIATITLVLSLAAPVVAGAEQPSQSVDRWAQRGFRSANPTDEERQANASGVTALGIIPVPAHRSRQMFWVGEPQKPGPTDCLLLCWLLRSPDDNGILLLFWAWEARSMGQFLVTLIVPPVVGVITYIIVRRVWKPDDNDGSEIISRRDPSAATSAEWTNNDA
jgi:hypothetical protein